MRALIQRVNYSKLSIEAKIHSKIGEGLLVLVGLEEEDRDEDLEWICRKVVNMRIFADQEGKMNHSLLDKGFEALVVSQFTLHASAKKGNRPSFIKAAAPQKAEHLYNEFCRRMSSIIGPDRLKTGIFGAFMNISLENSGPVTIWLDSKSKE